MPVGWFKTDDEIRNKIKNFCLKNDGKTVEVESYDYGHTTKAKFSINCEPNLNGDNKKEVEKRFAENDFVISFHEIDGYGGEMGIQAFKNDINKDHEQYMEGYTSGVETSQLLNDILEQKMDIYHPNG